MTVLGAAQSCGLDEPWLSTAGGILIYCVPVSERCTSKCFLMVVELEEKRSAWVRRRELNP